MDKAKSPIKIVPAEGNEPLPVQIIEDSIVEIARAMKAINNTRLTRKALVILIHHHSRISQKDIEVVLNNLELMESIWLKKK